MDIVIRTHFMRDDPKCEWDYTRVEVIIDGDIVRNYGDAYHDRGAIRADAFVEGFKFSFCGCQSPDPKFNLTYEEVADDD